jgi:hypothetical protein
VRWLGAMRSRPFGAWNITVMGRRALDPDQMPDRRRIWRHAGLASVPYACELPCARKANGAVIRRQDTSGPIPTFASRFGRRICECWNRRTTSNINLLVELRI